MDRRSNSFGVGPFEARVGPLLVVVDPPSLDDLTRLAQRREQRLVQAFVAQATVPPKTEPVNMLAMGTSVLELQVGMPSDVSHNRTATSPEAALRVYRDDAA